MQTTWLQRLLLWLNQLLQPNRKSYSPPKIIKKWYGTHCAVFLIERNTPGGISTYRITSMYGQCDYLLTLDYLPELHWGKMAIEFSESAISKRYLDDKPSIACTHRFAVFRVWRNGGISPIGVWDVNLERFDNSFSFREIASRRAIAGVALSALRVIHNKRIPGMDWQSRMERVDWLQMLLERARAELCNPEHNLRAIALKFDESSLDIAINCSGYAKIH